MQTLHSGFDSYSCSSECHFSLKIEETYPFINISRAEMSRNLEILSKSSEEAIKNTTLCKLHKVPKGFRPMGSNTDRNNEAQGLGKGGTIKLSE